LPVTTGQHVVHTVLKFQINPFHAANKKVGTRKAYKSPFLPCRDKRGQGKALENVAVGANVITCALSSMLWAFGVIAFFHYFLLFFGLI
jgi:hypothetical protein